MNFPASVLGAVNTLSVLSVSVFPRSQSLTWSPDQSGPPWWSSALSAPPWWYSSPSDPAWWSSVLLWWSSALLWWFSAPPVLPVLSWLPALPAPPWFPTLPAPHWFPALPAPPWFPALSAPPWFPALPQSPVPPLPHGPDPPFLPLFRLHSTVLQDCTMLGVSGSRSLWGGSVTNPVHGLPSACHQRLPFHYIDFHITQTVACHSALHFPCSISLITFSPVANKTHYINQSHTTI